jgi:DNA invertase Pin-like site-specific DNA recombinase
MSKTHPRRAYSYIRFSHPKQAEGGSLERQLRLTAAYCQRRGLVLDESLTLRDLGVSAFRSDNVRDGALAGFLEACRTKRVPRGSYLILENLDRLSRDDIRPALQLFLALQDFGITIVTHQPEREYHPDATDALALIEPLIIFARAHEESVMKSHRRKDGWRQARDRARTGGGPMLKTCPAWLEVTDEGFRVKEEAAAVVRRIYAMARDGLGVHRITERLTREGVPPIGSGGRWVKAYVYRILNSPAAMGTYQPQRQEGRKVVPDGEPIPGYYPAVVSEEEWNEAQAAIQRRTDGRGAGRKGAEETNLFTGLVHWAPNGEKMHIVHAHGRKGKGERKRYTYLCPTRETGVPAGGPRIDYPTFEAAVLSLLRELRPADIAPSESHANGRQAEIARLSGRLLDIDSRLERARQRARTAGDFDAFLDLIQELQAERKQVSDRLADLQEEDAGESSANLGEAQSLIDMLAQTPPEQREEVRRRLKGRIRQLVEGMWMVVVPRGRDRVCVLQVWFARGGRRRDYVIMYKPGKSSGPARTEGQWWAQSLSALVQADALDLRRREDAAELAAEIQGIDLTALVPPAADEV